MKEETISPKIASASMLLSCMINSRENRGIDTCNTPGALIKSNMDEIICVRLTSPLATLLEQFYPNNYEKCTAYKKGIPVIQLSVRKKCPGF